MANRRKFEDILTDLRDHGEDDLADELEKGYAGSTLRVQAERVPELESQLTEATTKLEKLEKAPAREKAFREFGVDFENLGALGRDAIEKYDGELEIEKTARFVERWELPLAEVGQQAGGEQLPAAAAIAAAARSAPAGGRPGQGGPTITPKEAAGWDADKRMRFLGEHPAEFDRLMKGETIVGLAFS